MLNSIILYAQQVLFKAWLYSLFMLCKLHNLDTTATIVDESQVLYLFINTMYVTIQRIIRKYTSSTPTVLKWH